MSLDLTSKNLEIKFKVTERWENRVFEFENFRLDAAQKLLFRNDVQLPLTPKAVETLIALVKRRGEVVGTQELMEAIWTDAIVEESNLSQYLHILRKALGKTRDGNSFIETLKRRGYRFNCEVRVMEGGNGRSETLGTAEGPDRASSAQRKVTNVIPQSSGQVNVRAFGHLAAKSEPELVVNVQRHDNIYSVSEWRGSPQANAPSAAGSATRVRWISVLAVVAVTAGLAGIAFGIYKYAFAGQNAAVPGVPFRESDITRLTTSGKSKQAAISPDGRYVAHVTVDATGDSLWVRQVAVANDTRIAGPSQSEFVWVTFTPDGNFVYYLALEKDKGDTELFRVPVLGGPIVKVAHDVGAPSISPDGTKLAYMTMNKQESRLIVADADGANEIALMPRAAPDYLKANETVLVSRREPDYLNMFWYAPAWSLDGKSIAFPVNQGDENGRYETVMAVDVATRIERKLTSARWQQVGQPRWLADGLVVTASDTSTGPGQLWHISLPEGAVWRISRDLNNYENLSLTLDTNTLAVIQDQIVSKIWTVGNEPEPAKQIMSESGRFNEIIWLPDGRLAYTSNAGGSSDIWTINADGSNARQLTVGANARLGIAVTADEKQLVFAAERDGKYNLWRIDLEGSNLTRITDGDGEYYPQCTPDGRWIVYQSGGNYPTLWKIPIDGGDPIQLTKTAASRPSLSPDGKFVAYHYLDSSLERSRWGIGISSLEDGKRVKRFDFPPTVVERIVKWSRDGKSIAFLNSPGGVPNIWIQPLDGGAPRPLTDFPSDSIISFNWTNDGSKLAVIRGVETSDVLLIKRSVSK